MKTLCKHARFQRWQRIILAFTLSIVTPAISVGGFLGKGTGRQAGSISDALDRYVQNLAERPIAHRKVAPAPELPAKDRDPQLLLALRDHLDRHIPSSIVPRLRIEAEKLARWSIRSGFGLPLTLTKKLLRGTRPLAEMITSTAKGIRSTGEKTSVQRLHKVVERVLGQVQNTNYLYAKTSEKLNETIAAIILSRKKLAKIETATPSLRYALLGLLEAQRKAEANLVVARDASLAQRQVVGQIFSRMNNLLSFLDGIASKSWSVAPEQVTLANHPQGLEHAADAFMVSLRSLRNLGRDNRTTRDLFKTHYKALVGIFQTYARAPISPQHGDSKLKVQLEKAADVMAQSTKRLSSYMRSAKVELAKLESWVGDLVAQRVPEIEIEKLPDWLLTDVSGMRPALIVRTRSVPGTGIPRVERIVAGVGTLKDANIESAIKLVDELAQDVHRLNRSALGSPLSDLFLDRARERAIGQID